MNLNYRNFKIILYILEIVKKNSDKGFINVDNGSRGDTHWCCFVVKDKKILLFRQFRWPTG